MKMDDEKFKNATAAIANAKKLLAKGAIKQQDYSELEEKLLSEMPMDQYVAWRDAGNLPETLNLRGPQCL
jgi:hypothetical protein